MVIESMHYKDGDGLEEIVVSIVEQDLEEMLGKYKNR